MIKKKGTYGELYVAAELTKAGFLVSIPFEQHSPYDLIIDDHGKLYKCQVKTTTSDKKTVKAAFVSHMISKKKNVCAVYRKRDVSHFLFFDTATDNILVVPHPGKYVWLSWQYDELPLTKYMTLNKTWARVFDRNWSLFGKTYKEALEINKQYCLDTYHEAVLSNQEMLPDVWGKYFIARDFANAFGVSRSYAKKFVEQILGLCYSAKRNGYSTNLLIKRSLEYGRA